jgi:hypothetical protein
MLMIGAVKMGKKEKGQVVDPPQAIFAKDGN